MGVVREIMKFYYRKGGRGLQVGSLPGALCRKKKREEHYFRLFYIILNLELGRKIHVTPCLQWPLGPMGEGSGQTHAYTYANTQVP
jgi:hypothetical protein